MDFENAMKLEFSSRSVNEAFARIAVSAFVMPLDPTVSELADIKTAVSEAVTNSIIHGYGQEEGIVCISCGISGNQISIDISDNGVGIDDIEKAREPLYTSKPDTDRSGMGFTVMETFMDTVEVESKPGEGTRVHMKKKLSI